MYTMLDMNEALRDIAGQDTCNSPLQQGNLPEFCCSLRHIAVMLGTYSPKFMHPMPARTVHGAWLVRDSAL